MLIAQISDTHILPPGERLAGRIDPATRLAQAVRTLKSLDVVPDCVLATGDLADRGEPEAYAELRRSLAALAAPVYAIPGNHDRREPLRQAFADAPWMPKDPGSRLCYRVALGDLVLVALDSLVEGEDYGMLGDAQLDWLARELGAIGPRPVLVMLHHPPVASGIAVMDTMKLRDADRLGTIVARHPNVERIVCGHLHRAMHLRWNGTVVSVPSSTVEQVELALSPTERRLGMVQEPPGLLLHRWLPGQGLVSHNVPVGEFPGPFRYE
ncbi:MAG TPA: phosphodiesterase [Sandaracinaceae bacterium]